MRTKAPGETTVTPTEHEDSPFRWIGGLDRSEGHAYEVDRGVAFFTSTEDRSPPSRGQEGQFPGPKPAGSLSSGQPVSRSPGTDKGRETESLRAFRASWCSGPIRIRTSMMGPSRPMVSPGVASAQGATLGR